MEAVKKHSSRSIFRRKCVKCVEEEHKNLPNRKKGLHNRKKSLHNGRQRGILIY